MSMADRDGVIWYDGEMVPWRNATTHVLTHTLHYGMGVFEGVRAYNTAEGTAIFRLQAHTDRLFDSAHIMNMPMPFSKDELNQAQRAVVRENNLESAYLRPMVFYGSEAMGLRACGHQREGQHDDQPGVDLGREGLGHALQANHARPSGQTRPCVDRCGPIIWRRRN